MAYDTKETKLENFNTSHFGVVTMFRSIYADLRTFLILVTFVTEREIVITDRKFPPRKIFITRTQPKDKYLALVI